VTRGSSFVKREPRSGQPERGEASRALSPFSRFIPLGPFILLSPFSPFADKTDPTDLTDSTRSTDQTDPTACTTDERRFMSDGRCRLQRPPDKGVDQSAEARLCGGPHGNEFESKVPRPRPPHRRELNDEGRLLTGERQAQRDMVPWLDRRLAFHFAPLHRQIGNDPVPLGFAAKRHRNLDPRERQRERRRNLHSRILAQLHRPTRRCAS